MKKSTILSLATAIAVVGTSTFTFAVWDQLDATAKGTVTFSNPVTITTTSTAFTLTESDRTLNTMPKVESSADAIEFTVDDKDSKTSGLKLSAVVKNASNVDVTDQSDITFNDGTDNINNGGTDTTTDTTSYKITIGANDTATTSALTGALTVEVTAQLQQPQSN